MDIEKYKRAVINHLRHGNPSDAAWEEVVEEITAASELSGPLLIDEELGFVTTCTTCDELCWKEDTECPQCGNRIREQQ